MNIFNNSEIFRLAGFSHASKWIRFIRIVSNEISGWKHEREIKKRWKEDETLIKKKKTTLRLWKKSLLKESLLKKFKAYQAKLSQSLHQNRLRVLPEKCVAFHRWVKHSTSRPAEENPRQTYLELYLHNFPFGFDFSSLHSIFEVNFKFDSNVQ